MQLRLRVGDLTSRRDQVGGRTCNNTEMQRVAKYECIRIRREGMMPDKSNAPPVQCSHLCSSHNAQRRPMLDTSTIVTFHLHAHNDVEA
jgi:hypothetical protein